MAELLAEADPPAAFLHLPMRSGEFTGSSGPWFASEEAGKLVGGFRVLAKHLNPNGVCHGGMLATFCDVMMPTSAAYQSEGETALLPTVSMSLDYMEPTPAGAWVEIRTDLLRRGRRMLFAQALVTADGRLTVRANGVFAIPSSPPPADGLVSRLRLALAAARFSGGV